MKSRFFGALFLLAACSSDATDTPPPTSESLFEGTPPPATPKLRGLYSQGGEQTQPGGKIEVRYRFIEKYVVGSARCVTTAGETLFAGKSIALDTTALDAAEGKLSMGALTFEKRTATFGCGGGNPNSGTFDFTVKDNKLTLTIAGAAGAITLDKIGD